AITIPAAASAKIAAFIIFFIGLSSCNDDLFFINIHPYVLKCKRKNFICQISEVCFIPAEICLQVFLFYKTPA
ncbi:hypothetical protein, partial [Dialister succinatiphilus]|uniref:hypothetical protein n=1 Tax=Dialister succinatiphilus TaxID=487173 RepID=UPI004027ED07